MTLDQLTELLGWALIINMGFLTFAAVLLMAGRSTITAIHSKMFDISQSDLSLVYFKYLAQYKTLTFVLVASPYFALKILGH